MNEGITFKNVKDLQKIHLNILKNAGNNNFDLYKKAKDAKQQKAKTGNNRVSGTKRPASHKSHIVTNPKRRRFNCFGC